MINHEIILLKPENILKTYNCENSVVPVSCRRSSVIIIPLCGRMDFVFSDKTLFCDKENAIFIPKGTTYKIICHEYAECLLFNFQTSPNLSSAESLGEINIKNAKELFQRMEYLFEHKKNFHYMLLSAYYELFSLSFDNEPSNETAEKYVNMAESIMIKQFPLDTLTCGDIATECNISLVYLRKLFLKYRNTSPARYLLKMRMKKAKMYLAEGYSVKVVAQSVGYRDVYQFSRAYKKYFGYPPTGKTKSRI